jgi:tyrosinase
MRSTAATLLCGAASVAALNIHRNAPQLIDELFPSAIPTAVAGEAPSPDIPIFVTHTWPLLSPNQALTSLHAKASATPTAVSILPGLVFPTDLASLAGDVGTILNDVTDGFLEDIIDPPTPTEASDQPKKVAHDAVAAPKGDAVGSTAAKAAAKCTNPQVRPEWRSMSDQNKKAYVNAVKCLMGKPARTKLAGVKSRYDDLVAAHQQMNAVIHNVGQFLPWHRYFLHIFYANLQNECGYKGPLPWWDETKDAGDFNGAPPFTDTYEGHMPEGNTVCITSGVFANTQCNIGPGSSNEPHCLSRGVNETLSSAITTNFVNTCNSYNDYTDMQNCHFFGPHGYGHDAVGGVMLDVQTSPADPAFFLHHAFVDRNWRIWQRTNPSARTYQIGGYTTQNCGSNCQPTTLNYVLSSMGLSASTTVDKVMDTQGGYLCYHYDY